MGVKIALDVLNPALNKHERTLCSVGCLDRFPAAASFYLVVCRQRRHQCRHSNHFYQLERAPLMLRKDAVDIASFTQPTFMLRVVLGKDSINSIYLWIASLLLSVQGFLKNFYEKIFSYFFYLNGCSFPVFFLVHLLFSVFPHFFYQSRRCLFEESFPLKIIILIY